MANVILVNGNNDMIVTKQDNIMQHSKNVHIVKIFVPIQYGDHNMTDFGATIEIVPPNQKYKILSLEAEATSEKQDYIQYNIEISADYTVFSGDLQMEMTFVKTDLDTGKTYVRKTNSCTLNVIPVEKWNELITDDALTELDQRLVSLNAVASQIEQSILELNKTKADDHRINSDGDLVLTSYGLDIGTALPVTTPSTIDDEDSYHDGVVDLDEIYI